MAVMFVQEKPKMLKIRKKLAEYGEIWFLIYILITGGMRAIGRGVSDMLWLTGIAFLFLGIKLIVTDYSKKELFWMATFGGLVILNFLINHERTLFLTMISIYGAKNVNLNKVFFYSLWSKLLLFSGQVALVCLGVIEGGYTEGMPKYSVLQGEWEKYRIPCLGFTHPNYAYLSIVMIAFLALLVYKERLKWLHLGMITIILFIFYKVLFCRSGWYMWVLTLVIIGGYKLMDKIGLTNFYVKFLCIIPALLAIFSIVIVFMLLKGNALAIWVNKCLTGRIEMVATACLPTLFRLLGNPGRTANEIAYIQLPYNYGWLLYLFSLILYIKAMYMLFKQKEDYYVIVFAVISIYFLGEAVPVSVGWNTSLLLMSELLFKGAEEKNVSKGIID